MSKVAVIAVHGVADQKPSDTVHAIADLLANIDADDGPRYETASEVPLDIPVRPVPVPDEGNASATFFDRAAALRCGDRKTIRQRGVDAGLEFMSGLLAGYQLDGPDETYHTIVAQMRRPPDGVDVHVFEMYWADLSRVATNWIRMFAEVFQLLFHVGSLGVHVVNAAEAYETAVPGPWRLWAWAQRIAADSLSIGFPVLNLTLVAIGVVLAVQATPDSASGAAAWFLGGLLLSSAAGYGVFRLAPRRRTLWIIPLAIFVTTTVAAAGRVMGWWPSVGYARETLATETLLVSTALVGVLVSLYNRVRPRSLRYAAIVGALIGPFFLAEIWTSYGDLLTACLRVAEVAFLALGFMWLVFIVASWIVFVASARVVWQARGEASDRVRRAAWTARVTLAVSATMYLVLTILLWNGASYASSGRLGQYWYAPSPLTSAITGLPEGAWADRFVQGLVRYAASVGFGYLLILCGLAGVLAIYAVAPIAVTEVFPYRRIVDGRRTGSWLDNGFHLLRHSGRLLCVGVFVAMPVGVALMLVQGHERWMGPTDLALGYGATLLVPVAGLVAFGGRLKALALGFRNILDVLLDVDNYLREQPAASAPRARICARFASLLRYVYPRYDAVVIIAHSQGTVIAADLLRFFVAADCAALDPTLARPPRVPVYLFTMGSPHRQLYGLRFPHLYRWARHALAPGSMRRSDDIVATTGPDPAELDVSIWVNAYRSGDYIGRHLWRPDGCEFAFEIGNAPIEQPWRLSDAPPFASVNRSPGNRREFCIGAGAHTHYWDRTAPQVARQLDELVSYAAAGKTSLDPPPAAARVQV